MESFVKWQKQSPGMLDLIWQLDSLPYLCVLSTLYVSISDTYPTDHLHVCIISGLKKVKDK